MAVNKKEELQRGWQDWKSQAQFGTQQSGTSTHDQAYTAVIGRMENMLLGKEKKVVPDKVEKTLAQEVQSNVCPICLELMIPPKNKPMILFPCGHTFCAACLASQESAQGVLKCGLCKKVCTHRAANIALQNLICTFTNNKHLAEPDAQSLKDEESEEATYYREKLQGLGTRIGLLETHLSQLEEELAKGSDELKAFEESERVVMHELVDARDRMQKAAAEVELAERCLSNLNIKKQNLNGKLREDQEKVILLHETIKGLHQERSKTSLLFNATK